MRLDFEPGLVHLMPMERQVMVAAGQWADVKMNANRDPDASGKYGILRVYYRHSSGRVYVTRCRVEVFKDSVSLPVDFERVENDGGARGPLSA